MEYRIALLKGDGIGPEITDSAVRVLEKTGMTYCFSEFAVAPQLHDAYLRHVRRITREEWEQRHRTKRKS